ncbi:hypothetical protein [Ruegeria atlantica]|uniref:hypothetical protein n=1 Tax=Ruegeria atlantica TaxID=81569 RepID=UPI0014815EE3|nr:hypothetical protein [Ruegeria atlantica]
MSEAQQVYIDGISNIAMINSNMRIDCFSFGVDPQADPESPPVEENLRLVLSPQGFLRAYEVFDRMFKEMESRGVIQRNKANAQEENVAVAGEPLQNNSPNFNA